MYLYNIMRNANLVANVRDEDLNDALLNIEDGEQDDLEDAMLSIDDGQHNGGQDGYTSAETESSSADPNADLAFAWIKDGSFEQNLDLECF